MFSSNSSSSDCTQIDVLIVGHGLAGAILAHHLRGRKQRVMVIDRDQCSSASKVAAGIINPVTGHRLNITEGFNQFISEALEFYSEFGSSTNSTVYAPLRQLRLIKNPGQNEYYQRRRSDPHYADIFGQHHLSSPYFQATPHGLVEIQQSGVVDTRKLLELSTDQLTSDQSIRFDKFDYTRLTPTENGVQYGDLHATHVVFCEGHHARNNPWLEQLPFKLSKGEVVHLELEQPVTEFLNWGHWLIPSAQGHQAKFGSTYDWDDLNLVPTRTNKLMENLQTNLNLEAKAVRSEVGIRPTTQQRKPFVGPVSSLANAYCFNGFGSKGCLLIPFYASRLCDHMLHNSELPNEVTQWL